MLVTPAPRLKRTSKRIRSRRPIRPQKTQIGLCNRQRPKPQRNHRTSRPTPIRDIQPHKTTLHPQNRQKIRQHPMGKRTRQPIQVRNRPRNRLDKQHKRKRTTIPSYHTQNKQRLTKPKRSQCHCIAPLNHPNLTIQQAKRPRRAPDHTQKPFRILKYYQRRPKSKTDSCLVEKPRRRTHQHLLPCLRNINIYELQTKKTNTTATQALNSLKYGYKITLALANDEWSLHVPLEPKQKQLLKSIGVVCTKTRENLGNEGTLRDAAYCGFNIKKSSINPKRNCLFSFEIHIWTHQSILQNPS